MNDLILHERQIDNLRKNAAILSNILQDMAQNDAASWRDGLDGWTVLDIMCHLRDYEDIFRERGELILATCSPTFPVYDHLAMVVERAYHAQSLPDVLADFMASREKTAVFLPKPRSCRLAANRTSYGAWHLYHHRTRRPHHLARQQSH